MRRAEGWVVLDDSLPEVFYKTAALYKDYLIDTVLNNFSNILEYEIVLM